MPSVQLYFSWPLLINKLWCTEARMTKKKNAEEISAISFSSLLKLFPFIIIGHLAYRNCVAFILQANGVYGLYAQPYSRHEMQNQVRAQALKQLGSRAVGMSQPREIQPQPQN